jgi:hypothetical protein
MGWIFKAVFIIALSASAAGVNPAESSPAIARDPHPAPAKEFVCGGSANPCPLQSWMRATFASASTRGDVDAMAKGFDFLAAKPPPGYSDWARIAKEGAALARKKDVDGAKGACQSCHGKYKSRYKEELRDRAL